MYFTLLLAFCINRMIWNKSQEEEQQALTECEAFINARLSSYFIQFKYLKLRKYTALNELSMDLVRIRKAYLRLFGTFLMPKNYFDL